MKIIVYGAGKTGIYTADSIRRDYPEHSIVGFVDDNPASAGPTPFPMLGLPESYSKLQQDHGVDAMVLGFVLPVAQRLEKAKLLASKGVYFPSLCSDEV
ncbi:MAG: hypothetical protein AABY13_05205, partial [Nanoarchaeota archaeon]